MPRRGENIRKRKDGRWEGRYSCAKGNGSETKVHSVYAQSYSEVKKKLMDAKQMAAKERAESRIDGAGICFTDLSREWLVFILKNKKYSTYVKYKRIYNKYLEDLMRGQTIDVLDTDFMEKTVLPHAARLTGREGISGSLEKSIYCVVCQILSFAALKYQVRVNPLQRTCRRNIKKQVQVFSAPEQKELVDFLRSDMDRHKLGVMLSLYTGLRLGELCALKWEDIDMENRTIHVTSTVQRLPLMSPVPCEGGRRTALMESDPKSYCSKREIPLNDNLFRFLSAFRQNEKYVICGDRAADPRTYQKKFASYLKAAGIEYRSFHTLRHTFASNCAAHGADAKSISEILGHASVQITLNRYVHPSMSLKRRIVNLLPVDLAGQKMGQVG